MVIYNPDRQVCGTVIGRNELKTTDENLAKLWKEQIAHLPLPASPSIPRTVPELKPRGTESHIHGSHVNDSAWADTVLTILKDQGYFGDIVE